MALQEAQQFFSFVNQSTEVLVALPAYPSTDAVASSLALSRILQALGKRVECLAADFTPPASLHFLPGIERLRRDIPPLGKLQIDVPLPGGVHDISHEMIDGVLRFHITPASGMPEAPATRTASLHHRFDVIITVGAPDLASLGPLHAAGRELFFRAPVLNIDHHPDNEWFGAVNVVVPTASSLAEVVFDLFSDYHRTFDEPVASLLLSGLIAATKSFKREQVHPRALAITADLMTMGGKREEIVQKLYRTRNVEALRLWGRALTRLKSDANGVVWTVIPRGDMLESGAAPDDALGIIDELLSFAPEATVALVLTEMPNGVVGVLETRAGYHARALVSSFAPLGTHRTARFVLNNKPIEQAEQEVLANLKMALADPHAYKR